MIRTAVRSARSTVPTCGARPAWVEHDFSHDQRLTSLADRVEWSAASNFIIEPTPIRHPNLHHGDVPGPTVHAQAVLHYGPTGMNARNQFG